MVAIFVSNGTMCCLPLFINFSSNFFITTFYICNRVLQMKLTSNVNCHYLSYICYRVLQMKLTSMSMPLFIIHLLQSSSDEADINVNAFIYHTSVTEFFRWSWYQCQCLYLSYICYRVLQMKLTSMSIAIFYHTSVTEFFRWSWHQCQCLYLSYICYRVLQMKLTSMSMPLFIIHLLQSSSDEADINVNAFIYHTSVTEFFRWSWHQCQCLYLSYICYRVLQMKLTSMSMPLFIIHLLQSSSDEDNIAVKELSRAVEELQKLLKESAEGTVLTRCFCLSLCLVICHCFVTGYYCECGWNISKLNLILYRNTLTGSFVIY